MQHNNTSRNTKPSPFHNPFYRQGYRRGYEVGKRRATKLMPSPTHKPLEQPQQLPQSAVSDALRTGKPLGISVDEAARQIGISRSLAYQLARQGRIPTIRLGKRLVVLKPALDSLLAHAGQEP